jgi:anti-anti-sigma factor
MRGEHDLDSQPAVMLALAVARDYGNVLVDLSGCTFIDSSIINALLLASNRVRRRAGVLELVVGADAHVVRRVLEVTRVEAMLPAHPTYAAGIASIDCGRPGVPSSRAGDLSGVCARIDELQATAESIRARRAADHVIVVRAGLAPDRGLLDGATRRRAA